MEFLKEGTAETILVGPFVDKTDGVTPETGITLTVADLAGLMKHDGTSFTNIKGRDADFAHVDSGFYNYTFLVAELNTRGRLNFCFVDADVSLAVPHSYMVLGANEWDNLFGATGVHGFHGG